MTEEKKSKKVNVKEFVKKNSGKILLVGSSAVAGLVLYKILKFKPNTNKSTINAINFEKLNPQIDIGVVEDCIKYKNGVVECMIDKIPIADIGNLGKEFMQHIPEVTENSEVWVLTCIREQSET